MKKKKELSKKQLEDKLVEKAITDIKKKEAKHGKYILRIACQRYANREREELRLKKEIEDSEAQLEALKSRRK